MYMCALLVELVVQRRIMFFHDLYVEVLLIPCRFRLRLESSTITSYLGLVGQVPGTVQAVPDPVILAYNIARGDT